MGWGRLREAPWTLWAFAVLALIPFGRIEHHEYLWLLPAGLLLGLVVNYFLLRGNRFFWWFSLVAVVGYIPTVVTDGTWPWQIPLTLIEVALLVVSPSRHYVFSPKESPPPGAKPRDPMSESDETRPSGWYFDPEDVSRMRYWNDEAGAWQGRTKTPRKMRKAQVASIPAGRAAAVRSSAPRDISEWDPARHTDPDRPAGWYFTPGDLGRMRYWDSEAGAWQGNARVPGRIRRRAERAAVD